MSHDRRSVIAALGLALPLGLGSAPRASAKPTGPAPVLRLVPFEEAVRAAFASGAALADGEFPCRRVEVGHSELLETGAQGSHNAFPFAGFPAGHLRIVRVGSHPGPVVGGVRLYVSTVDVALTGRRAREFPGRRLDFALLPPAPALTAQPAPGAEAAIPRARTEPQVRHKTGTGT